ncbi:MAG: alpha/beta hydrolase family protein [Pyramidobacter sp.]
MGVRRFVKSAALAAALGVLALAACAAAAEKELGEYLRELPDVLRVTAVESPEKFRDTVRLYTFRYRSDDCEVEGCASFPLKGKGPWPGLIFNRGGNREFSALKPAMIANLASSGYIVLASQYRGNCGGTGREEFGGRDVDDVIKLIDLMMELPIARHEGVYMLGRSRGGMMTYLACARDSRIRAAAVLAGMADNVMMYNTRDDDMKKVYHELVGGGPEEMPEAFRARSAVCWADKIIPPILLCHGTADTRVVYEQAVEMDKALTAAGKDHKFITYEGADHSLKDTGAGKEALKWFAEHPLGN